MHWTEIQGWFEWRTAQVEAVRHFPDGSRVVEVGSYLGRSLCSLGELVAASGKQMSIYAVDTCVGSGPEGPESRDYHGQAVADGGGTFAGTLHRNVLACGLGHMVTLIVSDSMTAAALCADRSLDWVHLDARHDYEHVRADIAAWLPKVKSGGWISGDDFDDAKWPGLVRAVRDACPDAEPWSTRQWRWVVT